MKAQLSGRRNRFNSRFRRARYVFVSVLFWFLLIPLKLLDLLGFFYLFDLFRSLFVKTRRLSKEELDAVRMVFGEVVKQNDVRIRENSQMAKLGARSTKKKHLGFVLFRTVNFSRVLDHSETLTDRAWLIHELVHVLQFRYLGVQYILEALRAQRFGGYHYGGVEQLKKGLNLDAYNLEQQADIARDFYKKKNTQNPDITFYETYIDQIKKGRF